MLASASKLVFTGVHIALEISKLLFFYRELQNLVNVKYILNCQTSHGGNMSIKCTLAKYKI